MKRNHQVGKTTTKRPRHADLLQQVKAVDIRIRRLHRRIKKIKRRMIRVVQVPVADTSVGALDGEKVYPITATEENNR